MSRPSQVQPECASPFDSASRRVFLHLWRTCDLLRSIEDDCLSDFVVSAKQYNVLLLKIVRPPHENNREGWLA